MIAQFLNIVKILSDGIISQDLNSVAISDDNISQVQNSYGLK